jgi:hypothetical protein
MTKKQFVALADSTSGLLFGRGSKQLANHSLHRFCQALPRRVAHKSARFGGNFGSLALLEVRGVYQRRPVGSARP